eukprot:TRINITY_DN57627_c0_g1_i1.p1 TRINITY_DN57627_c0_g1~~TRINITY_DN57627_c0_g1_i1.p1  ORF type:complete len:335 (-),score=48.04 TRINITY_DN57627_c0_g1_i1:44-1027(-)
MSESRHAQIESSTFQPWTSTTGVPEPLLIAVDGNGTLLKSDGVSVSEYSRKVFGGIQARGIPIVLVTARPFEKAKSTCARAGLTQYVITENGSRAVNIADGSVLHESWLSGVEVAQPLERIRAAMPGECFFVQLVKEGGWIEVGHPWLHSDAQRPVATKLFARQVADVIETLRQGAQCAKTYVTVPSSTNFSATMAELRGVVGEGWELREIQAVVPGVTNTCDVQSTQVNKVDGLVGLCRSLGISTEHVWAFGDDANDVRMLSEMGWGVRMSNHKPALSGVGRAATVFSNDHDGVARYLEEEFEKAGWVTEGCGACVSPQDEEPSQQ